MTSATVVQLTEKFRAEAGAILRWMIEGAGRYYREGFEPSPAVRAATAEYFEDNDTMQQFMNDCVVCGPEFREKADTVYSRYQQWAEGQGFRYLCECRIKNPICGQLVD